VSRFRLDETLASSFGRIALGHVRREFPYKLEHVVEREETALRPSSLYPIFHGSFDWHSCVHGWWTLLTLRRLFPDIAEAGAISSLADDSFTAEKAARELAYFQRPASRTFERPYGWAWLLYLHLEAARHEDRRWGAELEPLAREIAGRFKHYLPILTYPIRSGAHFNTAFALVLAQEWAAEFDLPLQSLIRERAAHWFGNDRDCPAWEPSGDDFLSPTLTEALLMANVLPEPEFAGWFSAFLPRMDTGEPPTLFLPASVSDRSDGKIAHLDGLNLSRAWCWRSIAPLLPPDEEAVARKAADGHLAAAMPHISGDYMGEHWLASFALLALLA
jgi:hypothetical protein